jgi:hypothetical protein
MFYLTRQYFIGYSIRKGCAATIEGKEVFALKAKECFRIGLHVGGIED